MPKMPSGIARQGLIMVGLPLLFQLLFIFSIELLIVQTKDEIESQYKAALLIDRTLLFGQTVLDGTLNCMMTAITGKQGELKSLDTMRTEAANNLAPIRKGVSSLPEEKKEFRQIEICYNNISNNWEKIVNQKESLLEIRRKQKAKLGRQVMSTRGFAQASELLSQLNSHLNSFIERRQNKLNLNPATREIATRRIKLFLFLSISTGIIASIVIAFQFSESISGRIRILVENTKRFRHGKELLPLVPGSDEISAYDKAFHDMVTETELAKEYKAQLLSIVSHEIRTPLTSAQASLSNILAGIYGELDDASKNDLEAAENDVANTISMVNDLIDIERLKSGRFPLDLITINLPTGIEETIASHFDNQQAKRIQIDAQQADIKGDAKLIGLLLLRLMQVSLHYSIDDSPIKAGIRALDTQVILIIDSTYNKEIFAAEEYAVRIKTSLALCQIIAEIHGGTLESQLKEDGIHQVSLKLPLQK